MPYCCVPHCKNRSERCSGLSFYRIPANEIERKKWLLLMRRTDFIPTCNSRVCSWHFPDNNKAAGPARFSWNKDTWTNVSDITNIPEKKPRQSNKDLYTTEQPLDDSVENKPVLILANVTIDEVSNKPHTSSSKSIAVLSIEKDMLCQENDRLKKQLAMQKQLFGFILIRDDPVKVQYYTGLPSAETITFLEQLLRRFSLHDHSSGTGYKIQLIDQVLMTLMKLRLNLGHLDFATRFDCSSTTVERIFLTILSALYDILFVSVTQNKIPERTKNLASLPTCFVPFPNCRVVLNSTEVLVSSTPELDAQCSINNYYDRNTCTTLKALIGVAPNGVITYVSDLYDSSTSDKLVTSQCGILEQLKVGDLIIAEEGFTIHDVLPEGVSLKIPMVLENGTFTQEEVVYNQQVSVAREHVERSIEKLKLFNILDHIPYRYKKDADKILKVCVSLTHLQTAIFREMS